MIIYNKHISKWLTRKRVLLLTAFFSALLLGAAMYLFSQQNKWLELDYAKQTELEQQQDRFDDLFLSIQSAESAGRGYAATGNKLFVEKFKVHIASIQSEYKELKEGQNRKNSGLDPTLFLEFDQLVQAKINFMQQITKLCDEDNSEEALSLLATARGVELTDSILKINEATNSAINKRQKEAETNFNSINSRNNNLAYAGILAAILLIVVVIYFLIKEINKANKISIELARSKEHFSVTLNSINEGLITTGKNGEIMYMNPAAEKLTGWEYKDARYRPLTKVYNVVNEETGKPFNNIVSRIITERKTIELENNTLLYKKNSEQIIISNNGSPLMDANGSVEGAVLVFNDITEKKKLTDELKSSEKQYRNLFEQASDVIFIYSFDGVIHEFNDIICDISGYTKEEFSKLTFADILVGEMIISTEKYEAILAGQSVTLYRQFKTKAGAILDMEIKTKLLDDGRVLGFGRDVTERNRNEKEIKSINERYEILTKATSDTIWDWDVENDSILYNNGITEMFGYKTTQVDAIGDWWKSNIHPDDIEIVSKTVNDVFKNKQQTFQLEYRFRCANNTYKYIFDRAFVVYSTEGLPIRMIGAMQDVTKETEHEKNMAIAIIAAQEKEKLELGMELHDNVNQLLSATLLYLGMAIKSNKDGVNVTATLKECTGYINEAINDIRNLSHRLTPYSKEEVTLKEMLEWLTEPMQKTSQFEIKLEVDDFKITAIEADIQNNLYRIVQEQLNNIVKHAKAQKVEIKLQLDNDYVILTVTDDGIGFNRELIQEGIGLENIRRRTDMHAGNMTLTTSPNNGCQLVITLPLGAAD